MTRDTVTYIELSAGGRQDAPAGKVATHDKQARRGTLEEAADMAAQQSYIEGYQAGKRSAERYQRVGDKVDVVAFFVIGVCVGLAVALYFIAPAF